MGPYPLLRHSCSMGPKLRTCHYKDYLSFFQNRLRKSRDQANKLKEQIKEVESDKQFLKTENLLLIGALKKSKKELKENKNNYEQCELISEYVDTTTTIDIPPETEDDIKLECEFCKKFFKTKSEMGYHHMNMTDFCKSCKLCFSEEMNVWRFHSRRKTVKCVQE